MNDQEKINELFYAAKQRKFEACHSGNSGDHCERQLQGRTHYYDASTRRYFGCRVLDVGTDANDAVLTTIESVQPPHGPRVYRAVAFDIFGNVIHRTTHETDGFHGFKTADAARRELREFMKTLNALDVTRAAVNAKRRILKSESTDLLNALRKTA